MRKILVEIDAKQIEGALDKMDEKERERIVNKLLTKEFADVCSRFRKRIQEKRLTFDKINDIATKAKSEFYARHSS